MKTKVKWQQEKDYLAQLSNGAQMISSNKSKQDAMNPPEMLLASLGACAGIFLRPELERRNATCDFLEIELEAERAKPPRLFDKITLNYHLNTELELEDLEEAITDANANCFIKQSLNPDIEIISNIIRK